MNERLCKDDMATDVTALGEAAQWFVLRDLKRPNARERAWKALSGKGFEVFTPLRQCVVKEASKSVRRLLPVIPDLLFVHSDRASLDPEVLSVRTLQYRYLRGGGYREPMTVREEEMNRFMKAVNSSETATYYAPDEITPAMVGRTVRIAGGPLDGMEAPLLKLRGSHRKRIIVSIPALVSATVEVNPDFICLL